VLGFRKGLWVGLLSSKRDLLARESLPFLAKMGPHLRFETFHPYTPFGTVAPGWGSWIVERA